MRHCDCTRFVMLVGMLGAVPLDAAAAQDESAAEKAIVANSVGDSAALRDDSYWSLGWHWPLNRNNALRSARSRFIDWGTGGFKLQGDRFKTGRKTDRLLDGEHRWHRAISAGAAAWQGLEPDLFVSGGARIASTKSGFVGGPLLTRHTRAVSQEAFFSLQSADRSGVRLSVFDEGGWSFGNLYELADRMMNGEKRAKKGAALEMGILNSVSDDFGGDLPRMAVRLERAVSPTVGAETSATLSMNLRF